MFGEWKLGLVAGMLLAGAVAACGGSEGGTPGSTTETYAIQCDGTAVKQSSADDAWELGSEAEPAIRCAGGEGLRGLCATPQAASGGCAADDAKMSYEPFPQGGAPLCADPGSVYVWNGHDCLPYKTIDGDKELHCKGTACGDLATARDECLKRHDGCGDVRGPQPQ